MKQSLLFLLLFCNISIQPSNIKSKHAFLVTNTTLHIESIENNATFTAFDKNGNPLDFEAPLQQNPTFTISYQSPHNEISMRQRFTEEFLTQNGVMQLIVHLAIEFPTEQPDMHTFALPLQKGKPIKYYDPTKNAWISAQIKMLQTTAQEDFNQLRKEEKFNIDFPPLSASIKKH